MRPGTIRKHHNPNVSARRSTTACQDEIVSKSLAVARKLSQPKPENRGGWNNTYEPRFATIAEGACRLGATQAQLADLLGVTTGSIESWMARHKEFHDAVHKGLYEGFSPRVVRSLAEQAIGYAIDVEETKVTASGQVVKYTVRKHFPPNVMACIFWLKNRMASEWRDVRDHTVQHNNLDKLSSTSRQTAPTIRAQLK